MKHIYMRFMLNKKINLLKLNINLNKLVIKSLRLAFLKAIMTIIWKSWWMLRTSLPINWKLKWKNRMRRKTSMLGFCRKRLNQRRRQMKLRIKLSQRNFNTWIQKNSITQRKELITRVKFSCLPKMKTSDKSYKF